MCLITIIDHVLFETCFLILLHRPTEKNVGLSFEQEMFLSLFSFCVNLNSLLSSLPSPLITCGLSSHQLLSFFFSLQNPDIVLVHYLNVPAIEDCGKPCGPILCSINTDKKEWAKWTKEELIGQLKPMCEC